MRFLNRRTASVLAMAAPLAFAAAGAATAADDGPIKIGIIAEQSAILGQAIGEGAKLAVNDINAKGGVLGRKLELVIYDDHSSAADAVRAYQRAVQQDHVSAVVSTFISEVYLALEPWSARLKMPTITSGAASNLISKQVHDDYDKFKYVFEGWLPAPILAQAVCDSSKDTFVDMLHMKSAAIVSEDADWTTPLDAAQQDCLPKVGLKVTDHIRFNPDTTDFTPIFNKVEAGHPDVIITGMAHVGVQPTVQWHDQHVPIPMGGNSGQATNPTFWKTTNGAADGVITQTGTVEGLALTSKTLPIAQEFIKDDGKFPAFTGFTTYDNVMALAQAMQRAGSTDPDKIVAEMEKTNMEGTLGTLAFYGKGDPYTHAMKYGPKFVTGTFMQWQDGKQVCIWPRDKCPNPIKFPSFVKLPEQHAAN
ncbi:MAG TPA: ABC transporter substrate-binding protein [Stellaceae bacterium]|jgi:branched-chain amino acid transport system substrate-binding protein